MTRPRNADHWTGVLPFIQAYADGKTVEHRTTSFGDDRPDVWRVCDEHTLFTDLAENYRIKPEPAAPPMGNPDAGAWAKSFVEHVGQLPGIACDVATMTGWFANAMVAMHDHHARSALRVNFEFEDQLPKSLTLSFKVQDVFDGMYKASQLGLDGKGGVRVYPYVEKNGQRFYLVKLAEV